jgi:hypothetical protein
MPKKTLFPCYLALLLLGESGKVLAQNTPPWTTPSNGTPQTIPQWSAPSNGTSQTIPQWINPSNGTTQTIPQWSTPGNTPQETNIPLAPQWVEPNAATDSDTQGLLGELLGHTEPELAQSQGEKTTVAESVESNPEEVSAKSSENITSPLATRQFQLPTALHFQKGDVVLKFTNRQFFLPNYREGIVDDNDTASFYDLGFIWGITDNLQFSFAYQHVDSAVPSRQGDYNVTRRPGDNEGTIELKQKIWSNDSGTQGLSAVAALSFPLADRGFTFKKDGKTILQTTENQLVPSLAFPFTATIDEKFNVTLSPTVAFFPGDSAMFYRRTPTDGGDFGTTFGFATALSFNINPRVTLWGDAFFPLTGNNSVSRETGKPDTAIAYNVGLRYLVNPQVALDIYASNSQGSLGPLALTADRDLTALGANLVFLPDFIPSNKKYASSFNPDRDGSNTPLTTDGVGFFDGGTVPTGKFVFDLQGGSQGVLTALRYGVANDLELGIYLDYISGNTDESEQGLSAKLRLLNQHIGDPFTASLTATVGLPNEPFVNFTNNNQDEFDDRNLDKTVPFIFQGDDGKKGKLYIFTLSLPLNYQFDSGAAVWLTPIWGYVQRNGTEIAGLNVGGSLPVSDDFSLVGEIGANFTNPGNGFIGNNLENSIPWTFAVRWDPSKFFGLDSTQGGNHPQFQLYLTNRVGASPWQELRVRNQNRLAVGVGISIPF